LKNSNKLGVCTTAIMIFYEETELNIQVSIEIYLICATNYLTSERAL